MPVPIEIDPWRSYVYRYKRKKEEKEEGNTVCICLLLYTLSPVRSEGTPRSDERQGL